MLLMLHPIKKRHQRQRMNLSMAVIISHSDFKYLTRKLRTDTELGFFTYDNIAGRTRKYRYNYKAFYAAAGNSTFDIFKCSENGKLYVPGAFELFCYMEDN